MCILHISETFINERHLSWNALNSIGSDKVLINEFPYVTDKYKCSNCLLMTLKVLEQKKRKERKMNVS